MSLTAIIDNYAIVSRENMRRTIAFYGIGPDTTGWMRRIAALPAKEAGRGWYSSGPFAFRRLSAQYWEWRTGIIGVDEQGEAADIEAVILAVEASCRNLTGFRKIEPAASPD